MLVGSCCWQWRCCWRMRCRCGSVWLPGATPSPSRLSAPRRQVTAPPCGLSLRACSRSLRSAEEAWGWKGRSWWGVVSNAQRSRRHHVRSCGWVRARLQLCTYAAAV
eukprot:363400-Chlamydomonas_euryale.AAC.6